MLSKEKQDEIIKAITGSLQGEDLGVVVTRTGDGSLVLYINDRKTVIENAHRFSNLDGEFKGGN